MLAQLAACGHARGDAREAERWAGRTHAWEALSDSIAPHARQDCPPSACPDGDVAAVLRIRRPCVDSMVEVSKQLQLIIAYFHTMLAKRQVRMRDFELTSSRAGRLMRVRSRNRPGGEGCEGHRRWLLTHESAHLAPGRP